MGHVLMQLTLPNPMAIWSWVTSGWTAFSLLAMLLHAGHAVISVRIARQYGVSFLHTSVTRWLLGRYGEWAVWVGWFALWTFCSATGLMPKSTGLLLCTQLAGSFGQSFVNWRRLNRSESLPEPEQK